MAKQSVLSGDRWDSREGKNEFRGSNLKWSLPSNYHFDAFMQRGVYWYFFELLNGIMPQNCRWQFSARSSQDAGDVWRMHKQNFATQPRLADDIRGSVEVRRKSPRHGKTVNCSERAKRTVSSQLVWECRRSADWEADVSLNHSETDCDCRILVSASSQMSQAHFGTQATAPWVGEEAQSVGLQTMETIYFQWWVPVLPIPQWQSGRVCRRQGERLIDACVQPNDGNRGPSVMVWGEIQNRGRSELVVVDGAINRHWYIQILRNQMLPWATGVFGRNFVYVQDDAPPHTARDTASFLDQQDVKVMDWPARSPDMNPIEQLSMFGIKCQSRSETWMTPPTHTHLYTPSLHPPYTTPPTHHPPTPLHPPPPPTPPPELAELNNAVRQAWAAVRPGRVRTLVERMPRRVRALLAARGGHTRY